MPRGRRRSVQIEIRTIRRSLSSIVKALASLAPLLTAVSAQPEGTRRGRKLRLSPARRAALKLQGQYMGYVRGLKATQKAQVRKLKEARGIKAAIRVAKNLAGA